MTGACMVKPVAAIDKNALEQQAIEAIKAVYDPEIPVNIWELGLIYELSVSEEGNILVQMTLTAPACPVAESLPGEVQQRIIDAVPEANDVKVELVWEPAWTQDRMSEAAKLELGFL